MFIDYEILLTLPKYQFLLGQRMPGTDQLFQTMKPTASSLSKKLYPHLALSLMQT